MPLYESVAKLPIKEQAAEIDRRCREEYEKRQQTKQPLTPAHIQMICGISRQTYQEWLNGDNQAKIGGVVTHMDYADNARKGAEEKAAIAERKEVLQVWESICAAMLLDCSTDSNSKSAVTGANFALERSLGYTRSDEYSTVGGNQGLEALLARVAVRLATAEKKPAEIAANVALVSIPPVADDGAAEQPGEE